MPPTSQLLAYFIAVAIPIFYVYVIFTMDMFGTTKQSIVLVSILWGATGAFGFAYMINTVMVPLIGFALVAGLTAPILEEILKALMLTFYVRRPEFRYVVDGAVYGFAVGIGFAAIENLSYISYELSGGALTLAISRVLSTALMHATASGIVGLSLGSMRRVRSTKRQIINYLGIIIAIAIHIIFNNVVGILEGPILLLVAIGFGIGGGVTIGIIINQELKEEKERFEQVLGLNVGVSSGERKAVQNIGSTAMENIFRELEATFGSDKITQIRRMLALQANIGILQNNLQSPVSDRLRTAWEEEITELQDEVKKLRQELGLLVANFMKNVFPTDENPLWQEEIGKFDPTLVHTFDSFMRISELAESFTPDQLAALADRLNTIDIFADVSLANLENLSRAITMRVYTHETMLFDQGDAGDAMYLIEEGEIDIIILDQNNEEKPIKTLGKGSVVGEFAVLDGETRSARARAKGELKVFELNRQVFLMFIQSRPQVVLAMLKVLAKKARVTTRSVEDSIKYARHIADGNYQELQALAAETRGMKPVDPHAPTETAEKIPSLLADDGEATKIDDETPALLCQAFAQVAANIEEKENGIRIKLRQ